MGVVGWQFPGGYQPRRPFLIGQLFDEFWVTNAGQVFNGVHFGYAFRLSRDDGVYAVSFNVPATANWPYGFALAPVTGPIYP